MILHVAIISISKLLGNYNGVGEASTFAAIISISKLLGNYNSHSLTLLLKWIISISKLLGNYNYRMEFFVHITELYQYLNC